MLFKQEATFIMGAVNPNDLPAHDLCEIAFIGRSNVGKSSLLNALLSRRKLARTSKTPGRTKQLNLFLLANALYIVDLPGYGYAKCSKSERRAIEHLIQSYLISRKPLKRVFMLIDGRHGLKESDRIMMDLLDEYGVSYQLILTKVDKSKKPLLEKIQAAIEEEQSEHAALYPKLLLCSAHKKQGIEAIQQEIVTMKDLLS